MIFCYNISSLNLAVVLILERSFQLRTLIFVSLPILEFLRSLNLSISFFMEGCMNSPGDEKFLRGGAEPSRAGEGVYHTLTLSYGYIV